MYHRGYFLVQPQHPPQNDLQLRGYDPAERCLETVRSSKQYLNSSHLQYQYTRPADGSENLSFDQTTNPTFPLAPPISGGNWANTLMVCAS